jgi:hypothetical protein
MNKIFFSFLLAILPAFIFAQNTGKEQLSLSGLLADAKGNAIDGAAVKLSKYKDSTKFNLLSNAQGAFQFNNLTAGYYKLQIETINFSPKIIDSIIIKSGKEEVELGTIILNTTAENLSEVIVFAERPLIENRDGKIIYNMSESPMSNGASTAEMMKNMPLMSVEPDGTIKLAGKVPLILIDEKPTNTNGQQLQDLLESLPANVVERVEIMQNPPVEYASYDGGVINIVTKKGKVGTYKKLSAGYGTRGEANATASYNYKSAKLNISSYLGYNVASSISNSYSRRQNIYKDSVNYFYTDSRSESFNQRPSARIQADYDFSKRDMVTFVYQGGLSFFSTNSNILYQNLDSNKTVYKASTRENGYDGNGYWQGISASYLHKGKNPVEKLQLFLNLNAAKNDNDRDFYQQYLTSGFVPTGIDSTQNQYYDNYSKALLFKTDYTKPLNDTGTIQLATGFSYAVNGFHNVLNTNSFNKADSSFVNNVLLSNNFYFTQSILTVRGGLLFSLPGQVKLILGVQAENTVTAFDFIKGSVADIDNGYWSLLPNFSIRKQFNKQLSAGFYYRQTIRRPGITELNPSIDYSDPYNIRYGNPFILPALTHNYDANLSYNKNKFNIGFSAGYGNIRDVFNSIRKLIDSGKTTTTYQNISDQEELRANFWGGITLNKVKLNVSGGFNYNKYSDIERQLYKYIDGGGFYSGLNISYMPDKVTNIEINTRYNSFANPQGKGRTSISTAIGVQRKFFKKQFIVALNAIDPFGLLKYNSYTSAPNFNIESYSQSNTRNFRITLSYQITKTKVKSNLSEKEKKNAVNKLK